MGKTSIAIGWVVTLLLLAYGIWGAFTKGIFLPLKHSRGGYLLNGLSAWVAVGGVVLMIIDQTFCLFALPPGNKPKDAPMPFKVLRFAGALCVVGAAFMPGSVHIDHFPY